MVNDYLRHTLATIDYRFQKSISKAQSGFGSFSLGKGSRSPNQLINHMYAVLNFSRSIIADDPSLKTTGPQLEFQAEVDRFNTEIKAIDLVLSSTVIGIEGTKRLIQGPLSDILTHVGQISMLQRIHGDPILKEDYSRAEIKVGPK